MKFYKKHRHLISAYIVAFIAVLATLLPIIWVGMLSLKSKGQTLPDPQSGFLNPLFLIMQKSGKMIYLQILLSIQSS